MRNTASIVILGVVSACSKSTDEPRVASESASAAAAGSGTSSAAAPPGSASAVSALPGLDLVTLCSDSALLLVDVPLAQAGKRFCELCLPVVSNACSGVWPDDFIAAGEPPVERVDRMRNAIYAAYGFPFRKERWKKLYGARRWYKQNDRFKESDLSKTAAQNVAALGRADTTSHAGIELEVLAGSTGAIDLDGDGKPESISVAQDGSRVTAGVVTVVAKDRPPSRSSEVNVQGAAILDIDRKKPGKQLALRYAWDEDESGWVVFDIDAAKAVYVGEVPPGEVPGDGTVITTSWHCGVTTRTTFALGARGFVEKGHTDTGKHDPSKCAACPYVYLVTADGPRFQGEILRYHAGADAYRTDVMTLEDPPLLEGGVIRVEVREVEPETTYLDSIQLAIDGELVDPLGCDAAQPACVADRRFVVIGRGDARAFDFRWRGPAPHELTLRATGYYLPYGEPDP